MKKSHFVAVWIIAMMTIISVLAWKTFPQKQIKEQQRVVRSNYLGPMINEPIQPIPNIQINKKKALLGKRLFFEKKLSKGNKMSCGTCHNFEKGGADAQQYFTNIEGEKGNINTSTVFNSGFNFKQFWDGRAETLEQQVGGPLTNPKEMGSTWPEVVEKLKNDETYVKDFQEVYQDSIQISNISDAIAEYERSLSTPNSRFDQYLRGNNDAITVQEKEGYRLFKDYGCSVCHQGINVGGNMFQAMGKMANYFEDRKTPVSKVDYGLFNVTKRERDRYKFKVPSLRTAALTAPYFHDGSIKSLKKAVQLMGKYQLGLEVPDNDAELIVKFLHSLVGELHGNSLEPKFLSNQENTTPQKIINLEILQQNKYPEKEILQEFSIDDLEKEAQLYEMREEKIQKMRAGFAKIQNFQKRKIKDELKLKAWERFLSFFKDDIPETKQDNQMRKQAQEQCRNLQILIEKKHHWDKKQQAMDSAFTKVHKYQKRNIPKALKLKAWKRFASFFKEKNPYSDKDDEFRKRTADYIKKLSK
ncbi:cytochrome-c peroxidase [Candidatus Uabimicrobium sp. HlEnr_7]|uniref:cytochrome-c peroxidase n=1 Tax=Candidatus Uabimicrobium helgolandensis TaxID=3095367 RepID=UPI0035583973